MLIQRRRQRANIKKTFLEKLMNIHYLNFPPYPNRWMVWLIQQGLAWRPRCVKTCFQEDGLKLPVWKVGDRGTGPRSGIQVSKKQNVSYPLTREDSILWGASVTERWRARPQTARVQISSPVSGGQCHMSHLTILRRFSWPSLAYILTQVA